VFYRDVVQVHFRTGQGLMDEKSGQNSIKLSSSVRDSAQKTDNCTDVEVLTEKRFNHW
jgi:hypothetical protein